MGLKNLIQTYKQKIKHKREINKLKKLEYNDFNKFIIPIQYGKVIKVYDGDTITIGFYLYDNYYRQSVRLKRVDTPELRSSNYIESEAAAYVKNKLQEKIMDKIIYLYDIDYDKYGRILAEINLIESKKNININDWLLNNNYGVPYYGGKKEEIDWSYIINVKAPIPIKNLNNLENEFFL